MHIIFLTRLLLSHLCILSLIHQEGEACIVYLPKFEAGTHQGGRGKGGLLDFAHRLRVTFVRRIKGGTYKTKNPNAHVSI